jgi:hypothetical protein
VSDILTKKGKLNPALERAIGNIANQKSMFDDYIKKDSLAEQVKRSNRLDIDPEIITRPFLPPIPPNPVHETNEHLESVVLKLNAMVDFMERSTMIATDLQVAAASFIGEFQDTARKTDHGARIAIGLSAIAVLIALCQIFYAELYKGPKEATSQAAMIAGIKKELAANREASLAGARQVADAIAALEEKSKAAAIANKAKNGKER